ncbi:MAG: D-alanine--D-alanine ligase family protein [Patescibacteria group bacterium]
MSKKIKILILQGGISSEHDVSLMSGAEVVKYISEDLYDVDLVTISKQGVWVNDETKGILQVLDFEQGMLSSDLSVYDVVFNALHGEFGEDGKLQALLDLASIKYTGSGVLASAWGMDKKYTNNLAQSLGITIPRTIYIQSNQELKLEAIISDFSSCVIKPNNSGSSVGTTIVESKEGIKEAIDLAFDESEEVLVQECIKGRELTCAVIGSTIGKLEAYPVVEIVSKQEFYDYAAKYVDDATEYICPAKIGVETRRAIQEASIAIHKNIGADGLTRSDFILGEDGTVYFLEINTAPGLTSHSLAPKAAAAVGISYAELLDKIITLALGK